MVTGTARGGNPGRAGSSIAKIREIERTEGLPAAEDALVAAIRDGQQSPQAYIALGRVLLKQRKFEDAARAAARAKALAPLDADPFLLTGFVHLRQRQIPEAAEAFADAVRLDPGSARAQLGAAAVKLSEENYDDALALCERAIEVDPSMERAHELIARINMKMGRSEEAIAELRGLIERNPQNRRALRAYVSLLRRENRSDEALEFLEQDAAANPEDKRRAKRLAAVGARAGRAGYATEQYERLVSQGSAKASDKVRYVMALIQAGETEKARAMISGLGSQKVLRPVVQKLEGDIALKAGEAEMAVQHYQAACRTARVEGLPPEKEAAADGPVARARAWRQHTQASLVGALRERRAGASAAD